MTDTLTQPLKATTKSIDALTQEIRAHLQAESTPPAAYPIEAITKTFALLIQQLTLALTQIPRSVEQPPAQQFSSPQQVDRLMDDLTARITQSPIPQQERQFANPKDGCSDSVHRHSYLHRFQLSRLVELTNPAVHDDISPAFLKH